MGNEGARAGDRMSHDVITINPATGAIAVVPEVADPATYASALDQHIRASLKRTTEASLMLGALLREMRYGRIRDPQTGEELYTVQWAGYDSYPAYLGDLGVSRIRANVWIRAARVVQLSTIESIQSDGLTVDRLAAIADAFETASPEEREQLLEMATGSLTDIAIGLREWRIERLGPPAALPDGRYRCIVIDPPWPMPKIEREERPNQGAELDYPTMTIEAITDEIGAVIRDKAVLEGCHIYLWTTHKFLPDAQEMFRLWGVSYECLLTWVKPTGITPFSWQYNTEHALFGRTGSLRLDQQGLKLSIEAPVTRHSEKPDAFYERVRAASPGPRLELFARRERSGFEPWGNQVERLSEAAQ